MNRSRIQFLDIAKGIGIIMVVLGHCVSIPAHLSRLIFSVHMPLFFILSGYTFKPCSSEDIWHFIRRSAKALLLPYAITCMIIIIVQTLHAAVKGGDPGTEFFKWLVSSLYASGYRCPVFFEQADIPMTFIGAIWFLPALFFARTGVMLCLKSSVPFLWVMIVFFTGLVTSSRIGWFPFSIQAGLCAMLFLYVGLLIRKNDLFNQKKIRWLLKLLMLCIWGYCVIFCGKLYMVENTYTDGILDIIGAICGTFIIIYISQWFDNGWEAVREDSIIRSVLKCPGRLLAGFGRCSLGIMCAHLLVLDCCPVVKITDWLTQTLSFSYRLGELLVVFAGTAVVAAILYLLPFIGKIFFPVRSVRSEG